MKEDRDRCRGGHPVRIIQLMQKMGIDGRCRPVASVTGIIFDLTDLLSKGRMALCGCPLDVNGQNDFTYRGILYMMND